MNESLDIYHLVDRLSVAIVVFKLTNSKHRDFDIVMANDANLEVCGVDMKQFVGKDLRATFPGIYELGFPEKYY